MALPHLTLAQWLIVGFSVFVLGISKSGINSISLLTVSSLAFVFGAKVSTGLLLPMLSFADVLAVQYYRRHTRWQYLWKLLPSMIVGILIGVWVGKDLDEGIFKKGMAVLILLTVASMIWWERRTDTAVPRQSVFAIFMGLGAGFTTMVGNLAGAFSNLYFLAVRLPKNEFIGTAAWLFLIVNAFKIPFHVWVWHTISVNSLSINLVLLPIIVAGFYTGVWLVKRINEQRYRQVIIGLTALASVVMLLVL